MKIFSLSIVITFAFISNTYSIDITNLNKNEQAIIYQTERKSIKDKYEKVIEKIKTQRDYKIEKIKKENKKSQFDKIILEHKKYLSLSRTLREDYLRELSILRETYNYYKSNK